MATTTHHRARAFASERARVFLTGVSEPDLKAGAASLGDPAGWAVADVTDSAQVRAAVERAVATFGRLDIVVANAGIAGATAPVAEYPEDAFDATVAVHVRGAFLLCKHAVPHLESGASVIITSSVVGLMRTLAAEVAPRGIRVNTIHPGRWTTSSSTASRSPRPAPTGRPRRRPSSG